MKTPYKTLDEALIATVKEGRLNHFTLAPTGSGQWMAALKEPTGAGYRCSVNADPVMACIGALTNNMSAATRATGPMPSPPKATVAVPAPKKPAPRKLAADVEDLI